LTITSYNTHETIENGKFNLKLLRERNIQGRSEYTAKWTTPLMNTFFEPVPGGCCGASEEGHMKLIAAWETAWSAKGWETRVLNMDDARKHPDFEKMDNFLARIQVTEYNRRCFFRWLAMAANGGGWMSDYDTFPLNFDSEIGARVGQYGVFTSFEKHVPSLISANRDEWEKLVEMFMKRLEKRKLEDGFISDMLMLLNIKHDLGKKAGRFGKTLVMGENALSIAYTSVQESERKLNCKNLENMLAIHLSHSCIDNAIKDGKYPIFGLDNVRDAIEVRGDAALIFMDDYEKQCQIKSTV